VIIYVGGSDFNIVDPISTFIFSIIVLLTTRKVIIDSISILMEGSPEELELEKFETTLGSVEGVKEIHDLHVWSLSANKLAMSAHIISDKPAVSLRDTTKICKKYKIYHSTI
jgi:zinc transporter 2